MSDPFDLDEKIAALEARRSVPVLLMQLPSVSLVFTVVNPMIVMLYMYQIGLAHSDSQCDFWTR